FGCYYLTTIRPKGKGENMHFGSFEESKLAYELGVVDLRAEIDVRDGSGGRIRTTVGRIIFNDILPKALGFINQNIDKGALKSLIARCYKMLASDEGMAEMLDGL